MRQWQNYAQHYKNKAGLVIAERFIVSVEEAISFIEQTPNACPLYDTGNSNRDLQNYTFRKWNVRGFPHMVIFRMGDANTIFVEVLYAQMMDISARLDNDVH